MLWSGTPKHLYDRSVCLVCGHPPVLHGYEPLKKARVVDDYEAVQHIDCAPVATWLSVRGNFI